MLPPVHVDDNPNRPAACANDDPSPVDPLADPPDAPFPDPMRGAFDSFFRRLKVVASAPYEASKKLAPSPLTALIVCVGTVDSDECQANPPEKSKFSVMSLRY